MTSIKTNNASFTFQHRRDPNGNSIFEIEYMRGIIDVDYIEEYLKKLDNQYNQGKFKSLILLHADSELTISARKLLIEEKKNR